jgi:preprotein translocase subunit SecY
MWNERDIRNRVLISLALLAIYRLAANIPAPGVDHAALDALTSSGNTGGNFLGFLNLLSGGTISKFSLLSMGVYPYITAQIIIQLLVPIFPALEERLKNSRDRQKIMEKWTYYLAVPMAVLSSIGQINLFNSYAQTPIVAFGWSSDLILHSLTILISMTAGTMFAIWLGELISEYGIRGQGLSLVIFAGIVAGMPQSLLQILSDEQTRWIMLGFTLVVIALTIFAIVIVQEGARHVPVFYPHSQASLKAMQSGRKIGQRAQPPRDLELRVNMAGMIPLIFASALLQFPVILASFFRNSETVWVQTASTWVTTNLGGNSALYWILYFLMVVAFTFFYTTVLFDQQKYGENLQRIGAKIQGRYTAKAAQDYLKNIQIKITLPGAIFLGIVAILPFILQLIYPPAGQSAGLLLVSSSGLLIVVGVVRDTFRNIEAELKIHGIKESILVK